MNDAVSCALCNIRARRLTTLHNAFVMVEIVLALIHCSSVCRWLDLQRNEVVKGRGNSMGV